MKKFDVSQIQLREICRRNHINKLSLFGSVLRTDFTPDSDIDVLVEFESDHIPGFIKFVKIQEELRSAFGERPIDLHTYHSLSRYFRQRVLATAQEQYVRA